MTVKYVTKIKRGNKPESTLITELYCTSNAELEVFGSWVERSTIILHLKYGLGKEYKTLANGGESAKIILEEVNDGDKIEYYLTTESNGVAEDNLGNLPEE